MTIALTIFDLLIACALIGVVLLQSGKSAGLSGSIAGGAESFFGGKKKGLDEFLGKMTKILAAAFMIISLLLAILQ
ncbi:MAG: preprotein translocase subunit SecG [Clostridia bacterium]|nr:preprotein translocase subunit SecG [Clostridia bacterium]